MKRIIVDCHCDTLEKMLDENSTLENTNYEFNIIEAQKLVPYVQCLATFVDSKYNNLHKRAENMINKFYDDYNKLQDKITLVKEKSDFQKIIDNNLLGVILTIENGSAIGGDLKNIEKLYEYGIKIMSITWNTDNELGCGSETKNDTGLTKLGEEYVKKLEEKSILIDVSHASKNTFYDVAKIVKKPIIATHSCVEKLCKHERNLSDEQIKIIAKMGGVIGVCFSSQFLTDKEVATSDDIIKHIDYIVNLVGIDYVCLGSDFDGVRKEHKLLDIKTVKDINILIEKLEKMGYKKEDIDKILGYNFIRVF